MKRFISVLLVLVITVMVGLTGCANVPAGMTGNYREDTLALVTTLRQAINLSEDVADKAEVQAKARKFINDFAARYRRDGAVSNSTSFTTMRTALNSLAGHYSSYPNRPVPEKLKNRLEQEFQQVESALKREA
jgi:photosystem II Psb27 protein